MFSKPRSMLFSSSRENKKGKMAGKRSLRSCMIKLRKFPSLASLFLLSSTTASPATSLDTSSTTTRCILFVSPMAPQTTLLSALGRPLDYSKRSEGWTHIPTVQMSSLQTTWSTRVSLSSATTALSTPPLPNLGPSRTLLAESRSTHSTFVRESSFTTERTGSAPLRSSTTITSLPRQWLLGILDGGAFPISWRVGNAQVTMCSR
mmetsp:Transcript_21154/g.44088  ORF Transcript_21154/g.44088 Transcript_21154/m.44088 type:complete len:205 (+) Transcript_21154:387-1001(+)